jgi:4-amino-4-deoxy-L-arabinose transferase-like glycosyltransferase
MTFVTFFNKHLTLLHLCIIGAVSYLIFFYNLDSAPVYIWDESRLANSAIEMTDSNNWLIPTFNNTPDMWSVKPPLVVILQAICMKIFGYNELAIRLPSAIAAVMTVLLLYYFLSKKAGNPMWALFACFILCTSTGYIQSHVARTGDYDSLLIFFLTAGLWQYYLFLSVGEAKRFYFALLFFLGGVLTKGSAGLLFFPGIILFSLLSRTAKLHLKTRIIIAFLAFIGVSLSYFFYRDSLNPGYIKAVLYYEFFGRLINKAEFDTHQPWYFYFDILFVKNGIYWSLLFLLSIPLFIKTGHKTMLLLCYTCILTIIVFFCFSVNKNRWYVAPLYPLIALCSGYSLFMGFSYLREWFKTRNVFKHGALITIISCLVIFTWPVINSFHYILNGEQVDFYGKALKINTAVSPIKVLEDRYWPTIDFYCKASAKSGHRTILRSGLRGIKEDDYVLVNNDALNARLDSMFALKALYQEERCFLFKVGARKK